MKKTLSFAAALLFVAFTGCKNGKEEQKPAEPTTTIPEVVKKTTGHEQWETKIDYSNAENWLKTAATPTKEVDVFYYYPTCYSPTSSSDLNLCSIDNQGMRAMADVVYAKQATAFEDYCNIYAPFYRQLDAGYALTLTNEENEELFHYAISKDATEALNYYFEHYNNGRPFILAGHSQGSETSLFLLSDYFKAHHDYYQRMVAAYIIGYSVTSDYLAKYPHVKFATGADDTGVVISWNTEGPGNSGQHNAVLLPNAIAINPINWKLDATKADVTENLGSLDDNNQVGVGIADAQIDTERGSVICTTVDPAVYSIPAPAIFGPECYHGYDYGFYYANIRENAKKRIEAYLGHEVK